MKQASSGRVMDYDLRDIRLLALRLIDWYGCLVAKPSKLLILSLIMCRCTCKVEVSGFCKVEMSKLPFRQMAEAEIGIFDDERKRIAAH